ncbi:MAG: hypothetical protein ACSLFR_10445 [Solirubrobacteraceae bacterium]
MSDSKATPPSPASTALLAAIDQASAGESSYPERAACIDADHPDAGHEIARAAAAGRAVVLCSADGTQQVLHPDAPAAA